MSVQFECIPRKIVYSNNDYYVYGCDCYDGDEIGIKFNKYGNVSIYGNIGQLNMNVPYLVTADEEQNKYGFGYKVKFLSMKVSLSQEGLKEFLLGCELSSSQADEIIAHYPNIIQLIQEDKTDTINVKNLYNIGEYRLNVIIRKIKDNLMLAEISEKLGGYFSFNLIKKLFEQYHSVNQVIQNIEEHPYQCLCEINRIGFKTADNILLELENKINKDIQENKELSFKFNHELRTSKDRCLSAITWLLDENETNGNTILSLKSLMNTLKNMTPECYHHFIDICKNVSDDEELNKLIYIDIQNKWIARAITYQKECKCGQIIANALKYPVKWDIDVEKYRCNGDIKLTDGQLNTLKMVCDNNISVLSGWAGTGKTASTLSLIQMLKDNNKSFLLLSPTGKAAKVLHNYTKCNTQTIHKLLFSLEMYEQDVLPYDLILVDEISMCDLSLFYDLMSHIDFTKTKILFVGDESQLPSVGAGNILYDIINSTKVPVNNLTQVFRYGDNSILTVATDIRNSQSYLNKPFKDNQYTFIDVQQEKMLAKVKALYQALLNKGYNKEDILILSAYNKGEYGTVAINNMLQPIVNKNVNDETKHIIAKSQTDKNETIKYCVDDIVIQIKNNYKAMLCDENFQPKFKDFMPITSFIPNGETGVIKHIERNNVYIQFNDGIVVYDKNELSNIKLAYSISVHKSQGSGVKIIILLTPKSHTYMLNSNLLYVGVTRASERVFHFGTSLTVNRAIKKKADLTRHTWLKEYIVEYYNNNDNITDIQNNIKEDN